MNQRRTSPPRSARLLMWPGHGVYLGPLLPNTAHSHHALQVTAALDGRFEASPGDDEHGHASIVVFAPDEPHALCGSATTFQLYLDPYCSLARRLALEEAQATDRQLLLARVGSELPRLRQSWRDGASLGVWRATVSRITEGEPFAPSIGSATPMRSLDERVAAVLALVHAAPDRPHSLAATAAFVHLSPSRLGHLFNTTMGLPFRRYVLWVRLVAAIAAMENCRSLADVAHEVAFADQAHLARTFRRMFGIAPSLLRSQIDHVEIDIDGWMPPAA